MGGRGTGGRGGTPGSREVGCEGPGGRPATRAPRPGGRRRAVGRAGATLEQRARVVADDGDQGQRRRGLLVGARRQGGQHCGELTPLSGAERGELPEQLRPAGAAVGLRQQPVATAGLAVHVGQGRPEPGVEPAAERQGAGCDQPRRGDRPDRHLPGTVGERDNFTQPGLGELQLPGSLGDVVTGQGELDIFHAALETVERRPGQRSRAGDADAGQGDDAGQGGRRRAEPTLDATALRPLRGGPDGARGGGRRLHGSHGDQAGP